MEVQTAALLFSLFLLSAAEDCMHCTGEDYRGNISITESGFTCQRWDSQTPHNHVYIPAILPGKHLEENYCRNPDGQPKPWCFTTNPSKRWEFCSVPRCLTEPPAFVSGHTCATGDGSSYRGIISVTKSGKTCQSWESQTPHFHFMTPENFPCKGLRGNYCRNPDSSKGPWCFTADPETRWEYCNVPRCEDQHRPDDPRTNPAQEGELIIKRDEKECIHCKGQDYRGKISTTESGYTCQRWDSQKPHGHDYDPSDYPGKHLEENYCRNPDDQPRPWCWTASTSFRWEYCSIPQCTTEPPANVQKLTCATDDGISYRGNISVTASGKTCQRWTSDRAHNYGITPTKYPCSGLEENYCRNPSSKKGPWCFTKDSTNWEYCNVPICKDPSIPAAEDCMQCKGEEYRGKISITESGYTCQRWDSQRPHKHEFIPSLLHDKHLEENYCRNPDGKRRPWCYTRNPSKRWEFCSIPKCATEPTIVPEFNCATGKGRSYRGTISVTDSGKTCQKWTSQISKKHFTLPENFPCGGLEENYCRNPNNRKGPWCYTADPRTKWEYCDVPDCEEPPRPAIKECLHCNGEDYRGHISITESGNTCQRWDSQTPHKHLYIPPLSHDMHLEENYCRNPDRKPRPWCYTTDPSKSWEFCLIPKCRTEPPTIEPMFTCATGDGSSYRGPISVTKSGKTCQKWTSNISKMSSTLPKDYPCSGLQKSYCRNPDGKKLPWCYTTDPKIEWEYCDVPVCEDKTEECMNCRGIDYGGKISTTENGYTCQRWDSQRPHKHDYIPAYFAKLHLVKNYCRNPSGDPKPWCYTTDPDKRWEYCSIPQCTNKPPTTVPEHICASGDGRCYRGTISVTKSGKTCRNWKSDYSRWYSKFSKDYPCNGIEGNYCRNPDGRIGPWCYTTDRGTEWEFCNVPSCEE